MDQDAPEKTVLDPELLEFDMGYMPAGAYEIEFEPLHRRVAHRLDREVEEPVLIQIPRPVPISVGVYDKQGQIIDDVRFLTWTWASGNGARVQTLNTSTRAPENAHFEMLVPDCEITLRTYQRTLETKGLTLHPEAGRHVRLVASGQPTTCLVRLANEGQFLPLTAPRVRRVGGDEHGVKILKEGAWLRITVAQAGLYEVDFPKPYGFQRPEPQRILIVEGEEKRVQIPLSRDPNFQAKDHPRDFRRTP